MPSTLTSSDIDENTIINTEYKVVVGKTFSCEWFFLSFKWDAGWFIQKPFYFRLMHIRSQKQAQATFIAYPGNILIILIRYKKSTVQQQ